MVNEFIENYKAYFKNALDFKGKTGRREFFIVFLVNCAISFVLTFISVITPFLSFIVYIFGLIIIIPSIAIVIRRMHDINKSGWLALLYLIPVIGLLILLVFCAMPSVTNKSNNK